MSDPAFQAQQAAQRAAQAHRQATAQAEQASRQAREAHARNLRDGTLLRQTTRTAAYRPATSGALARLVGMLVMLALGVIAGALILTVLKHVEPGLPDHVLTWLKARL